MKRIKYIISIIIAITILSLGIYTVYMEQLESDIKETHEKLREKSNGSKFAKKNNSVIEPYVKTIYDKNDKTYYIRTENWAVEVENLNNNVFSQSVIDMFDEFYQGKSIEVIYNDYDEVISHNLVVY